MNPEDELRGALGDRAAEVEPANDSYARLAQRVSDDQQVPPPWWQSPRVVWLGAAGTVAILLVVIIALVFADDGDDFVATPQLTPSAAPVFTADPLPTPSIVPEATESAIPSVTPTAGPTPTPLPTPPHENIGEPAETMWPRAAFQPFGEWPGTPAEAAQQFVRSISGWDLPVGQVTLVDPVLLVADVTLQSTDEEGNGSGEAVTVRVAGGLDEEGVENWGVRSATSDRIAVDGTAFSGPADGPLEFTPTGQAHAFEGVVDVVLVTTAGSVVADGFVMGGGVELAPITGAVTVTLSQAGPGFAVFADLGGLGLPSAITIVAITFLDVDAEEPADTECSATGLDMPEPNTDIPAPVEAKRQAIAAAAIACDYTALAALTDPAGFTYSFGGGDDPATFWEDAEGFDAEPMRFLVELLNVPHGEDGTAGTTFYVWPEVFLLEWEDVTPQQEDELRPLFDDEDFAIFSEFGGYFSYRIAIDETGEWIFFVAGD